MESDGITNLTNISRESGIPLATLRTFCQILEDTFIGYRIPAFGAAGRKRALPTPRFLLFDNGARNAAAHLRLSNELLKTQKGLFFENWVGQEKIMQEQLNTLLIITRLNCCFVSAVVTVLL